MPHPSLSGDFFNSTVGQAWNRTPEVSDPMGLVLLIVIWLITFISTYFFIAKTWWLPTGASAVAAGIDNYFAATYIIMGIVFVAAQVALGFFAWKYHSHRSAAPARYTHGNNRLEIIWTLLTAILFIGLNLMSSSIWASERFRPAVSNAVQVEVTGMQFAWYFRYPGPDGKFGATKPESIDPSAGGEAAVGLDTTDPASKDDIVTGTMYAPVNREVEVILRAHDVIHSFFIPQMRFKQDAVPGLAIRMHFTPIAIGDYEIACAELCGLGHYKMHGMLKVVSQDEYDKWLAAREAEKQ
jgi:cytochrome c oxidase subunit II